MTGNRPLKGFISYSHKDKDLLGEFHKALAPLVNSGMIEIWDDSKITPGDTFGEEISKSLGKAEIICLFISSNYLKSQWCLKEKTVAFAQAKNSYKIVIPVIMTSCAWMADRDISQCDVLPKGGKPLSRFQKNREQAWENIYLGIVAAIDKFRSNHRTKTGHGILPDRPYKYLNYFEPGDTSIFFGRERETKGLAEKIHGNKITLLYANSGAGKTSLINAGLIPALEEVSITRQTGYEFLFIRSLDNPLLEIKTKVGEMLGSHQSNVLLTRLPLQFLLHEFRKGFPDKIILIILDQFEEFFICLHPNIQTSFLEEFRQCVDDNDLTSKWLFSIREDYLGKIAQVNEALKSSDNIFINYLRLLKLNKEQAIEAIKEPAKKFGISLEPKLVERIYNDLVLEDVNPEDENRMDELIDPPHLQIICEHLYNKMENREITAKMYNESGGAEKILNNYLNTIIYQNYPEVVEKQTVKELFKEFITPENTKRFRTIRDIRTNPYFHNKYSEKEILALIKKLCDLRLLREYSNLNEKGFELTHEYLTASIVKWIGLEEVPARLARSVLEIEFANYTHLHNFDTGSERFKFIDNQRDSLVFPAAEAAYMLCISLKNGKQGIEYWLNQNRNNAEATDSLFLLLKSITGNSIGDDNLRRDILIIGSQFPLTPKQEDILSGLAGQVGNPSLLHELKGLLKQGLIDKPAFIQKVENKIIARFWKPNERMVCIPQGDFIFGSSESEKKDRLTTLYPDTEMWQTMIKCERNLEKLYLGEFWIDKYAVTNKEFAEFDNTHKYDESEQNFPATGLTWEKADQYCQWLGKRLPTEEEWEKAARGCEGFIYPWGDLWDPDKCNALSSEYEKVGSRTFRAVDSYPNGQSPFGCYNMAGNTWEWTSTDYEKEIRHKIAKGGSASTGGKSLACCSSRYKYITSHRQSVVGFRAASSGNIYREN